MRLRIIQAMLGDRTLTTGELSAEMGDVPAGSLYRHVARLAQAGVLEVVAERRVRGAVERTYRLRADAARMSPAEVAAMSVEDHTHAFMAYVAGMLADVDRYLGAGQPDPVREGADYRVGAVWLTDAEFTEFLRDLASVIRPRMANKPGKGRHRRLLYGVMLPARERPAHGQRPGQQTRRPRAQKKEKC